MYGKAVKRMKITRLKRLFYCTVLRAPCTVRWNATAGRKRQSVGTKHITFNGAQGQTPEGKPKKKNHKKLFSIYKIARTYHFNTTETWILTWISKWIFKSIQKRTFLNRNVQKQKMQKRKLKNVGQSGMKSLFQLKKKSKFDLIHAADLSAFASRLFAITSSLSNATAVSRLSNVTITVAISHLPQQPCDLS